MTLWEIFTLLQLAALFGSVFYIWYLGWRHYEDSQDIPMLPPEDSDIWKNL